jgi:hypothetical protein
MGRAGNGLDDALAESLFHSIQAEWRERFAFDSRAQGRSDLVVVLERFDNRSRLHSSRGYRCPAI